MRKTRELLRLKYELGRSHREIATSLGTRSPRSSGCRPCRIARPEGFRFPSPRGERRLGKRPGHRPPYVNWSSHNGNRG